MFSLFCVIKSHLKAASKDWTIVFCSIQYRSKISEPLNAFPTQSQRVGVLNLTRLRLRVHANANAFSEAH